MNQEKKQSKYSLIVIGAGLSGLTAADQVLKQNPSASILILEAMPEPGGRTKSIQINGAKFDLGGQWVGKPQKYTLELIQRAKLETAQQHSKGDKLMELGKELSVYKTNIPMNVGIIPLAQMQLNMWKIDRMAKTVPLENPRDCPNAVEWDSITIHSWIQQNIWFQKVRKLVQVSVRSIFGCETNQISALFFLWYVHQNHGFQCLVNIENGLQQTKIVNGAQSLSKFLAKQITSKGGKIQFNSFVNEVRQTGKQVLVRTRKGKIYVADYLIIAAPPVALKNITFEPQLSRERRLIRDRYVMGSYSKMVITYDKNYWREKGFSGQVLSDCHQGPILLVFDETKTKDNGETQAALVVFISGSAEEEWTKNEQHCKKTVVEKLASYFKCEQMLSPSSIHLKIWSLQQSIQGAPIAFTPPGVLTRIENMRQPEGRIHWAGTETARVSQGFMDGAIESGIRVSRQIVDRMNGVQKKKQVRSPTSKWYSKIETYKRSNWLKRLIWW